MLTDEQISNLVSVFTDVAQALVETVQELIDSIRKVVEPILRCVLYVYYNIFPFQAEPDTDMVDTLLWSGSLWGDSWSWPNWDKMW